MDHAARPNRRLTPAHVPPNRGNRRKVSAQWLAWGAERRSLLDRRPGRSAVEGAVDPVGPHVDAAAALVHSGDENGAPVVRATGELNVADEVSTGIEANRRRPGRSVIGVGHENR